MKAIIVTHPTNGFKALLYGISYDKLCSLAELRAKNKETIKKRYQTLEFKDEKELQSFGYEKQIRSYKLTDDIFRSEVEYHFNLK
jgi:hypothetical protein